MGHAFYRDRVLHCGGEGVGRAILCVLRGMGQTFYRHSWLIQARLSSASFIAGPTAPTNPVVKPEHVTKQSPDADPLRGVASPCRSSQANHRGEFVLNKVEKTERADPSTVKVEVPSLPKVSKRPGNQDAGQTKKMKVETSETKTKEVHKQLKVESSDLLRPKAEKRELDSGSGQTKKCKVELQDPMPSSTSGNPKASSKPSQEDTFDSKAYERCMEKHADRVSRSGFFLSEVDLLALATIKSHAVCLHRDI